MSGLFPMLAGPIRINDELRVTARFLFRRINC